MVGQITDPVDLDAGISGIALNQLPLYREIPVIRSAQYSPCRILLPAAMALTRAEVSPRVSEVFCNNRGCVQRSYFFRDAAAARVRLNLS